MKVTTRVFGDIDIEDEKIIHFQGGIVGFPDLTDFALIHDAEKDGDSPIRWMQSLQEPNFAMPVMDPLAVCPDYNPVVEDELLRPIGEIHPDSVLVLVTLTVPKNIKEMSVNLQAPFVINADEKKACQIIVDSDKYPVRFPIYDIIKKED
ncbi:MAG: flagellar assembly protein FliW [Lachnospiraceae bacterium]|nr:flagellar assembly protein FliW [Lachnospiraceae bacterium]